MKRSKRRVAGTVFSLLLLAAALGGCVQQGMSDRPAQKPSETAEETQGPTASDLSPAQTLTFQVNDRMPMYSCTVAMTASTVTLDIVDAQTGAPVQSITQPTTGVFTKDAVYARDVTFSGNLALLIPYERSARSASFSAFLWDEGKKQFVEAPSFRNIRNPCIDEEGKRILSYVSGDNMTVYSMYAYKEDAFQPTGTVSWMPARDDETPVSDADKWVRFREEKGGDPETVVEDFLVASDDGVYDLEESDARVKPYMEPGSFWDLKSDKWNRTFYEER